MTFITNAGETMKDALSEALKSSDHIDVLVGYFFFSGFESLAEYFEDKKIRVLVGLEADHARIAEVAQYARQHDEDIEIPQQFRPSKSAIQQKRSYIDALVALVNESDTFDSQEAELAFDLFVRKLADGSLEIRKTLRSDHSKLYILHDSTHETGTVLSGSSNFTYRGLVSQGECNERWHDSDKYLESCKMFEDLWATSSSVPIVDCDNAGEFVQEVESRIWLNQVPSAYELYIRVLHELFGHEQGESIITPAEITSGAYSDLEYQLDAIKMALDRLERYDGVIIADVVGLGKSIIAAAVAKNLGMKTVIIAPPHLRDQWDDYAEEFGILGRATFSCGKIREVFERYSSSSEPLLIIIDEAHRFRNEDTEDYKLLHQVCRSNPNNKIMLLTATPFNNAPKDIFALVKLFQTPGQATIRSVDNLGLRFRELIERYRRLRVEIRKDDADLAMIDDETSAIAAEQRRLIENIVIRRSRLDLECVTRYKQDLQAQGYSFAQVVGPGLLEYDLGVMLELYLETLEKITDKDKGFSGARYRPTTYGLSVEKLANKYPDIELADMRQGQTNIADFMRKLLVMRFESSKAAFRCTLSKMIETNRIIERWWEEQGCVPVMKKGQLPDLDRFSEIDGEVESDFDSVVQDLHARKGLILISKDMLENGNQFIHDVRSDGILLKEIWDRWFGIKSEHVNLDPKAEGLAKKLRILLAEYPERKIVIFSSYADTVYDLGQRLEAMGLDRILCYTASEASSNMRKTIKSNFDASIPDDKQSNDFDILIATDALSEGFNLHRAGVVINYDIPYNPTRVIQRVGRINRINRKVFDKLYVFNFFPTAVGEKETRIRKISVLKITLINAIVGSDTRHIDAEEELIPFLDSEYKKAETEIGVLSWDSIHRENYNHACRDQQLILRAQELPRRSRIRRVDQSSKGVVVYGKKGQESIFTWAAAGEDPIVCSAEYALPFFEANADTEAYSVDNRFRPVFESAKRKLFAKPPLPPVAGRRRKALNTVEAVRSLNPSAEGYCLDVIRVIRELDDISDGVLKDIGALNLSSSDLVADLKHLVPEHFLHNVISRAEKVDADEEILLFAEELV